MSDGSSGRTLRGWKEIGRYLRADERTVRRWEQRGMPIHRLPGDGRSAVYADAGQLDLWLRDRGRGEDKPVEVEESASGTPGPRLRRRPIAWAAVAVALVVLVGAIVWAQQRRAADATRAAGADPKAVELVAEADMQNALATSDGFRRAIELSRQALARDPTYAPAWSAIAFADIRLPEADARVSREEAYRKAQAAAQRALDLDPTLWRAHSTMGFIEYAYNWNFPAGIRHFREVIRLNPNRGPGHNQLGLALLNMGDVKGALAELKLSAELEAANPIYRVFYAEAQYVAGDKAIALATWRGVAADNPNAVIVREMLRDDAFATGNFGEALRRQAEIDRLTRNDRDAAFDREAEQALASGGPQKLLAVMFSRTEAEVAAGRAPVFELARVDTLRGDKDAAFAALQRSLQRREPNALETRNDAVLAPLRGDPRFEPLLRRYDITPASARE